MSIGRALGRPAMVSEPAELIALLLLFGGVGPLFSFPAAGCSLRYFLSFILFNCLYRLFLFSLFSFSRRYASRVIFCICISHSVKMERSFLQFYGCMASRFHHGGVIWRRAMLRDTSRIAPNQTHNTMFFIELITLCDRADIGSA